MKKNKLPTYKEDLLNRLRDPAYAEGYLNATLEDEDRSVFLLALRDVVEAHGGMTKLSRSSKITREHLYSMLSSDGNPGLETLKNLLAAVGLKLAIEAKPNNNEAA